VHLLRAWVDARCLSAGQMTCKTDVNYIRTTVDEIKRDIKEARPR
jgi:hypothetical protein